MLAFHYYPNHFLQKYTITNINCQHNAYLESIKTSIICRKLGKRQKHNKQILKLNLDTSEYQ